MTLSVTSKSGAHPSHALRFFVLALAALITLSATPLQAAFAASAVPDPELQVASVKNFDQGQPLDTATVRGNVYVWTKTTSGLKRVAFHIDDVNRAKTPYQVENSGPWELAGGAPFDSTKLSEGVHTLTAALTSTTGSTRVVTSTFTVDNVPDAPATPPTTAPIDDELQAAGVKKFDQGQALDRSVVSANIYVWTKTTSGVSRVAFHVDDVNRNKAPYHVENSGPWELAGGAPFDTTKLSEGDHTVTAVITMRDGKTKISTAGFKVDNVPDAPVEEPTPPVEEPQDNRPILLRSTTRSASGIVGPLHGTVVDTSTWVFADPENVPAGTARAILRAGSTVVWSEGAAPYGDSSQPVTLPAGSHTLVATYYDASGAEITTTAPATYTVNVANTTTPPPVEEPTEPSAPSLGDIVRVDFEKAPLGTYTPDIQRDGFVGMVESNGLNKSGRKTNVVNDPLGRNGKVMEAIVPKEDDSTVAPYMDILLTPTSLRGWDEARVSYDMMLNEGFDFSKRGGKLGWHLAGTNSLSGEPPKHCATVNGDGGFSARTMWWKGGDYGLYLYDASKPGSCGESMRNNRQILTDGRWHHVEQRVKVNSIVGGKAQKDSIYELWVDGQLVGREIGRSLRTSDKYSINWLRLETYFGGKPNDGWGHNRDERIYFDNIRVWSN